MGFYSVPISLVPFLRIYLPHIISRFKMFKTDVQSDHRCISLQNLLNDWAIHNRIYTFVPSAQVRKVHISISNESQTHAHFNFDIIKYYSVNFTNDLPPAWVALLGLKNEFSSKKICLMSTRNLFIWIFWFQRPRLLRVNGERSVSEIWDGARCNSNER